MSKAVKMAEKQQENGKESCSKDLLHKTLILLLLGKVSKPEIIFNREWEAKNIHQKWKVFQPERKGWNLCGYA